MASNKPINIYRWSKVHVGWKLERACEPETAQQWLEMYQKDEPQAHFQLGKKPPAKSPDGHWLRYPSI